MEEDTSWNHSDQQILIIDDARDIREPLGQYLRKQGFRTQLAPNAGEARRIVEGGRASAIARNPQVTRMTRAASSASDPSSRAPVANADPTVSALSP